MHDEEPSFGWSVKFEKSNSKEVKQKSRPFLSLTKTESETPKASKSSATIISELTTITQQWPNKRTVSSLQKTIRDIQIQRQELDITVKVLNNYLNQILSTKYNCLKEINPMEGVNLYYINRGKSQTLIHWGKIHNIWLQI